MIMVKLMQNAHEDIWMKKKSVDQQRLFTKTVLAIDVNDIAVPYRFKHIHTSVSEDIKTFLFSSLRHRNTAPDD